MTMPEQNRDTKLIPSNLQSVHKEVSEYIPEGVAMSNAPSHWENGNEGEGVIVAVIDTGVDYNHPDLKDNIIGGRDFTGKGDYMDGHGHGTHVAGIIAASNNGRGIIGMAPKVKILALKALADDGTGDIKWTVRAIKYAILNGAHIINMSLGGPHSSSLRRVIKEAVSNGIIVIAASGNEGDGNAYTKEYSYPGAYPEVIQVGAIDLKKKIAYFSNTNEGVDLLALGVDVISTFPNGKYARMDGTSMATPHVSGAAALLRSSKAAAYHSGDQILDITYNKSKLEDEQPPEEEVVEKCKLALFLLRIRRLFRK